MPEAKTISPRGMLKRYDVQMLEPVLSLYYGYSDFHNFGYWAPGTSSQGDASEGLVEKLLSFIPEKQGRILDVACGLGASTRQLLRYYQPEQIVATNISEVQLNRGRENAPGVDFRLMDATQLDFPDQSFDSIICVEAAFHFETRERFLREAYRVLKPGGYLVHSDILMDRTPPATEKRWAIPNANYLENPEALRQQLVSIGFRDAQVLDTTDECWGGFTRGLADFRKRLSSWPGAGGTGNARSRARVLRTALFNDVFFGRYIRYYVLAASPKPR